MFALHTTQSALFVVVPQIPVSAGLPVAAHWKIDVPVIVLAFTLMMSTIIAAEQQGCMKGRLWCLGASSLS
ncbi:hypothetical protein [Candidatus Vallotiella sp. (ex Adelges kitamiensis)]|uniref:hypothetical protein n=1 Tax=Candidatus Vallotiella sp. (ex Adelges kitamiensis) TaxID=2864217 RepID=UPI00403D811C